MEVDELTFHLSILVKFSYLLSFLNLIVEQPILLM